MSQQQQPIEEKLAAELADADHAHIAFDAQHILQFVGVLLCARRDPVIPPYTVAAIDGMVALARDYFRDSPTVLQMIDAGELARDPATICVERLAAELRARVVKVSVHVDPLTIFNLAVAAQMASRMIKSESLLAVGAGFVRLSIVHFFDCPTVVHVLELGNDRLHDVVFRGSGVTLQ